MVKKVENNAESKTLTRAQKTEATRRIVRELLAVNPTKHNDLIDEVANRYVQAYGEVGESLNDVRGRVGSVLDIMKKNSEVMYDGGMYALKVRLPQPPQEAEKASAPKKRGRKKAEPLPQDEGKNEEEAPEKQPPKKRTRAKKAAEEAVAPVAEEVAETKPEAPAPKKRGRKKAEAKPEAPVSVEEKPVEEKPAEGKATPVKEAVAPVEEKSAEVALVEMPKAELAKKNVVMDMSFLFGEPKKVPEKKAEQKEKKEETPAPKKEEKIGKPPVQKAESVRREEKLPVPKTQGKTSVKKEKKALTPDEQLKESFLKKMRSLGGDYFEYYSTYLLERYSIKNGRRLEGLRISGGDHDGGIDGELELTDSLGFKETIYIQSKNWDPDKGKEDKWVVGETLLQQFIGACACRQAKEGKLHARGIFITTSRFTPEAKRILEDLSDKIVGYDGEDLYEAAKECQFGVVKKNGEWVLDEKLLAGSKAFFQMSL